MEIVIENLSESHARICVKFLKDDLREVLQTNDVRVEREWVELWKHGDARVEEIRYQVIFSLSTLDDHAMRVLTHAFEGTGFSFFAPELGMRWTVA